ncbi:YusW family protein [Oceanobacillus polygoni]|uniref:Small lipoprotein YifL n=1 Tax=Oceanobacillus polygoni TaxID=1235259 RepID=A0A9X0YQ88_9BACI|nr:YusW family protein [Oceanobacillus polygoni]MBP2076802.1 putative small lipoprotein YifL [Oceanobacillus polygoni]
MKKMMVLVTIMTFGLLIAACGTSDEGTNPPADNNAGETENNATDDQNQDDTNTDTNTDTSETDNDRDNVTTDMESDYPFTSFDLEADFEGTEDIVEVEYEQDTNETEASYRNETQGIQLRGDEAMQELDSIFSTFDFDENTPKEEVLSTVLEAFNIPSDAQHVELDIEFVGGTEVEYQQ